MKAILAGAGDTGRKIAEYLINLNYNVTFIDSSIDKIRDITDNLGLAGLYGECTSMEILEMVGIKEADIFIAITPFDEINIIACEIANFYGVKKRLSKITNTNYLTDYWIDNMYDAKNIAITSTITPNITLVKFLIKKLEYNDSSIDIITEYFDQKIKIMCINCTKTINILNSTVEDLNKVCEDLNLKIFAILRGDDFINILDSTLFQLNDKIYIIIKDQYVNKLMDTIGINNKNKINNYNNHITIIGDHPSISYLAEQLLLNENNNRVNILTNDLNKGKKISEELQKTTKDNFNIIYADLLEKGIKDLYLRPQEKIIIFNKNDRENVFLSLYCKYNNIDNVFCILQNSTYEGLMYYNGINKVYIADQFMLLPIINEIKQSCYEDNIFLIKDKLQIVEFTIPLKSVFVGKNLRDLKLNNNIRVLAAYSVDYNNKNDCIYLKDSNLILKEGDKILFCIEYSYIKESNEIFNQFID